MHCRYNKRGNYCSFADMQCNKASVKCYYYGKRKPDELKIHKTQRQEISFRKFRVPHVIDSELDCSNDIIGIHLFRGYLNPYMGSYEDCKIWVKDTIIQGKEYAIYVIRNRSSGEYYMPMIEADELVEHFKHPAVKYYLSREKRRISVENWVDDFNEESLLKMYGYTVGKTNGLMKSSREKILKFVIDNGIMTGYEVVSHLNGQISLREKMDKDFSDAIKDWSDDIHFVHEYLASKL